ncbi:WD40-repeat-containing domain protein [Melanogaster broomeanus]|nr:WD40-repeat-containing domain protein [Melanogaster broomeanus]
MPLTKRTPSRSTIANNLSIRKRRRVSIASFDLVAELGVPAKTAVEETDADRFVATRSSSSIPLHITPRTNRIAKSFGLVDDRVLNYTEGPSSPFETKVRLMLRRSASELFNPARKHFVMALDGPGISRDPFAFPMAWSPTNCIGVAFKSDVYYQNLETRAIVHLCRTAFADGPVHSIDWHGDPSHMSCPSELRVVMSAHGMHCRRSRLANWSDDKSPVGGMHWSDSVLAVGRKDGRTRGHKRHVHGIKWSPDGKYLATGDHSGTIHVWDQRANEYLTYNDKKLLAKHEGPVKAISWCPWQSGLVATGGGFPDGAIQIFDVNKLSVTYPPLIIKTFTNVTSLHWSPHCKELLSTHGSSWTTVAKFQFLPPVDGRVDYQLRFTNSMTVHAYPSCEKIVSVVGHSAPIAHSCIGPDGCSIFTVSPTEETIKMFKMNSDLEKCGIP